MPIRLTGMGSGLDIDSLVSDLMKAERIPVDKLGQKKQSYQWKVEAYNDYNLKFASLRDSVSSLRFASGWKKSDGNGGTVRLSTDEIIAKVKDFVGKYNELVTAVNGDLTEKADRNYTPLTSDQKSAMKDSDIATWEAKAKEGMLRNDSTLRKVLTDLRGITSSVVDGVDSSYDTLSEIGITTNKFVIGGSTENGKLTIDENKLRAAIEANPDAVVSLFTQQGDGDSKGLIQRVYESMNTAITQISRKINGGVGAAPSLNKQISDIEKRINQMNDRLYRREDYYYQMFSSMESAVSKGNSTLSWLMQQFG
ncbi:flagellar filament capping protein FliD [Paenibacillus xylaniclasticus]|uniref:flagellar filament capping protein FliD n=1 Tax=Paenibacillus xylaniclasticus TaxID=588083 RepID=UPI000FD7CBE0|nr:MULTISPECIES: flagellar filament capping protein FliD [Paenibacillus]GFN32653.1 hypothetical protein PCURB6_29130 [Paenibacillus curdlanolyticus]